MGSFLQQLACLLHRGPVNAEPAPGLVGLAREGTVDQRVSRLAHPGVERQMPALELDELLLRE
jgi:hypothetical protein